MVKLHCIFNPIKPPGQNYLSISAANFCICSVHHVVMVMMITFLKITIFEFIFIWVMLSWAERFLSTMMCVLSHHLTKTKSLH